MFNWPRPRALNRGYHSFNPKPSTSYNDNEDYWCETCDRGFATVNLLERHKQQHQKCNIDGCQFVAHPKMITKHIQMQHSSGLYKRISKLDNPEEIKKWREERKKNFPTRSNIEKKTAELNEKNIRGEKMGLKFNTYGKQDKKERNFKSGTKRKYEHKQNFRNKSTIFSQTKKSQTNNHPPPKKILKTIGPLEETRKLKPFSGIQNIVINDKDEDEIQLSNDNILIEDDDSDNGNNCKIQQLVNVKEPSVCTALNSLMCNYGSSEEDEMDSLVINKETVNSVKPQFGNHEEIGNEQNKVKKNGEESQEKTLPDNCTLIKPKDTNGEDDSGPEEITIIKANPDEINDNQNKANVKYAQTKTKDENKLRHKNNTCGRPKPKPPSTLLQKLLYKEIRHERNIILQCIRYVIKNNYFDED